MKNYNKLRNLLFAISGVIALQGCDTMDLDLLDSPNALNETNANPEFYINSIQLDLRDFFFEVTEPGQEVTRILHMFGPLYQNAYAPSALNDAWNIAYAGIMPDVRALQKYADEDGLYTHLAIGQIAEAYVMATLVDYLGDIPYSESNDPEIFNPSVDSGQDIYASLITLLDSAISNLNQDETKLPDTDFYYGGDETKWIKLANTLKLKLYVQSRLVNESESVSAISSIVGSGNFISTAADDFQFQFGSNDTNPDSRHPIFARNFLEGTGSTDYQSNTFMQYITSDTSNEDPRRRYYFYRQRAVGPQNTVEQSCYGTLPPAHIGFTNIYCNLNDFATFPGYWGRDHGYDFGIPPDTTLRTAWGLYPVGGQFDDNSFTPIADRSIGTKGAGIEPIMLSSFVHFMLAEMALETSFSGNAADLLEDGIRQSIAKVMNFRSALADSDYVPSSDNVDAYVTEIMDRYNAANADGKLNIIEKEYFKALFGNGVEAYNTFRRTGKPDDGQPLVREPVNNYLRSFFYPDDYTLFNTNATQKDDVVTKVFWDNNPDTGFIN